ncbi:WXG100 family type VII secretion target [Psychromicrobium silvestre]|uniref:WXG100 family type VII secretion target n=1 Tax=Psychromicrobium silvestre TaxID=1645614 RepID=UPI0031B5C243
MSGLRVDSVALRGFSGTLAEHAAELERRVVAAERKAKQVLGDSWTGVASDEVSGIFDQWFRGAQGVWEALNGLASFAGVSAGAYEVSEKELTAAAQNTSALAGLPPAPTTSSPSASSATSRGGNVPVAW